jgi:hypothetical protein
MAGRIWVIIEGEEFGTPRAKGARCETPVGGRYRWASEHIEKIFEQTRAKACADCLPIYGGYQMTYKLDGKDDVAISNVRFNQTQGDINDNTWVWYHGLLPVERMWPKIEKLGMDVLRPLKKPLDKEQLTKWYEQLAETIWLMGNCTPIERGTAKWVEFFFAYAHFKQGLNPPIFNRGLQLDCLDITYPLSMYKQQFLKWIEPPSLPLEVQSKPVPQS